MILTQKTKALILALGDLALFYISLYLALTLRYQSIITGESGTFTKRHFCFYTCSGFWYFSGMIYMT